MTPAEFAEKFEELLDVRNYRLRAAEELRQAARKACERSEDAWLEFQAAEEALSALLEERAPRRLSA